jgi:hypothetical protein
MGYEEIIIFGIDLSNSYYFWSDGGKEFGETHHKWNKQHEGKDPAQPHATYKIKDFIVDFNERWMKPNGRSLYVGHKNTLLYPEVEFKDITS